MIRGWAEVTYGAGSIAGAIGRPRSCRPAQSGSPRLPSHRRSRAREAALGDFGAARLHLHQLLPVEPHGDLQVAPGVLHVTLAAHGIAFHILHLLTIEQRVIRMSSPLSSRDQTARAVPPDAASRHVPINFARTVSSASKPPAKKKHGTRIKKLRESMVTFFQEYEAGAKVSAASGLQCGSERNDSIWPETHPLSTVPEAAAGHHTADA